MYEGLGCMLTQDKILGSLKGLSPHDHPPITHQQFMDENLLMGHPSIQEARALKHILSTFSKVSGMDVNHEKSEIFFFNTPIPIQRNISHILSFKIATLPLKYLGAPLIESTLKHSSWRDILTKLELHLSH